MNAQKSKSFTLDQMTDKYVGKVGTKKRDEFETRLRKDILGHLAKEIRESQGLTQEELGKIVGVGKAQISKVEKSSNDMKLDTVISVLKGLGAKVDVKISVNDVEYQLS